jgi:hypothetical protein
MPEVRPAVRTGRCSERHRDGVEVGIERVLLGHCVVEVVYDCR